MSGALAAVNLAGETVGAGPGNIDAWRRMTVSKSQLRRILISQTAIRALDL